MNKGWLIVWDGGVVTVAIPTGIYWALQIGPPESIVVGAAFATFDPLLTEFVGISTGPLKRLVMAAMSILGFAELVIAVYLNIQYGRVFGVLAFVAGLASGVAIVKAGVVWDAIVMILIAYLLALAATTESLAKWK